MRVLRLTPFFHHPDANAWPADYDSLGGMQIQAWRQAMWLAEHGVEQHVLTIGFPGLPRLRKLHPNLQVERAYVPLPEIKSEHSGLFGLTESWAVATLIRIRRLARETPFDLVHVHLDGQIPALLVARLASWILRRPVVLTAHCSRLAVYRPGSVVDRATHGLACALERSALAAASVTFSLTERTARKLRPFARDVQVVPDVIDREQFRRPDSNIVAAFRASHRLDDRTVGYIGRLSWEKGWPHLLHLAERLRHGGVRFLVVGDGPQRDRFEQEIDARGLRSQFEITGFIPHDRVPVAIAACDVIVMPSAHEEFGGVSIEASAVGTPVVGFAVGGLKEILGRISPELLAAPEDTEDLLVKVKIAFENPATDQATASLAAAAFSPDGVLPQVLDTYRAIVDAALRATGEGCKEPSEVARNT